MVNAARFDGDPRTLGLFLTAIASAACSPRCCPARHPVGPARDRHAVGAATWGASLCAFGLVDNAWLGLACLVLAGAADTASVVSRATVVQLTRRTR